MITIRISDNAWNKLNSYKKRGDTFEDVINRLLKLNKEVKKDGAENKKSVEEIHSKKVS